MAAMLLQVAIGERRRILTSLANFYSVEHALIFGSGKNLDSSLTSILSEIFTDRPRWDGLKLTELDPQNPSYGALLGKLRDAGLLVECTPGAATWFEETDGMSFSDYLAQRPSKLKNTWSRKRKSVRATGQLSSKFFSELAEIDTAIADYKRIYAASWKAPEPFPLFIPALLQMAAELGALRLGIYYIDGVPAATQFWIIWRRRAVIYKLAHDRRFDELSLGTLLTMEMMERVLALDHPTEINLGRGDDAYKSMWLPRRRERWGITASNPRTLHGLLLGVEREAAKLYHRVRGKQLVPP
jgi:hypothetical protein